MTLNLDSKVSCKTWIMLSKRVFKLALKYFTEVSLKNLDYASEASF
ncbi:hypothetical protein JOC55_000400 [Paenibacillus sacheonensis]|nr:hypothetical protein [Paenibacillus sacheonensis]